CQRPDSEISCSALAFHWTTTHAALARPTVLPRHEMVHLVKQRYRKMHYSICKKVAPNGRRFGAPPNHMSSDQSLGSETRRNAPGRDKFGVCLTCRFPHPISVRDCKSFVILVLSPRDGNG